MTGHPGESPPKYWARVRAGPGLAARDRLMLDVELVSRPHSAGEPWSFLKVPAPSEESTGRGWAE